MIFIQAQSFIHYWVHEFIIYQHNDQLPVGLLAQLVEHCIGIAKAMGSNPVQAFITPILKLQEVSII